MRPQLLIIGSAFISFACAGSAGSGGAPAPAQPGYGPSGTAPQAQYAPESESAPEASAAPGEGGGFDSDRAADEAPAKSRPGLGTTWGETRVSRISTAPFFREDPTSPSAVSSFFYNDASGVKAMGGRGFVSHEQGMVSVAGGALTVRLLDEHGRPLPGMESGGKNYIVGNHGQRYTIQIRNHTGARIEAVATVDGLDVIDGRDGSFAKRGYIVSPFSTVDIDGFRQSNDTVAAFRFGAVEGSYASRKGKGRNVGVIGVAFFHERGERFGWGPEEVRRRHTADPFPGQFAEPPPGW